VSHEAVIERPVAPALGVTWGKLMMWLFLASDAMSFGGLLAAYGAVRMGDPTWGAPGDRLDIPLTALNTFILIVSSVTMVKALAAVQRGDQRGMQRFLGLTALGGVIFLSIQAYEWAHLITHSGFRLDSSNFAATFFICTGFHGMHVFSGVVYILTMLVYSRNGRYGPDNYSPIEILGLYWHFVDLIWILVFTFVYLL
jgi:heme/copper-type cytochrome/quinol oxidase subunit 3